ncbi:MAG: M20 family metallo-hydrolase [Oscillospiraceae bacterium]
MDKNKIMSSLENSREEIIQDIISLSSIPAVNPKMGGSGEYKRMEWIAQKLDSYGLSYTFYDVPDETVPQGIRRNIVAKFQGTENSEKTLWFIAHVDTVNSGDLSMWDTDPFKPVQKGDKIYGLGVEDNSQAVIEMLQCCKILKQNPITAQCNLGFIFGSDEETGSAFGLHALLKQKLFSPEDEAIVPDGGSSDGCFVEIAEKSQVWIKFTVEGKQAHASMPHLGLNACSIGMHLGCAIEDSLKEKYGENDPLFNPPYSTFELTQKFANVDSANVMPGKDQFVMDLRILPRYTVTEVLQTIDEKIEEYRARYKASKISYEFLTKVEAPPPTNSNSMVVQKLVEAINESGRKAYFGGIGGGTCAAILRAYNIPSVVWSTLDDLAHQPNEYVIISNVINDTKIFMEVISKYK